MRNTVKFDKRPRSVRVDELELGDTFVCEDEETVYVLFRRPINGTVGVRNLSTGQIKNMGRHTGCLPVDIREAHFVVTLK